MSEFFVKPPPRGGGKITDVSFVDPKRSPDGGGAVIILERIVEGVTPDYCTHGKVTCYWCGEWCWLGDQSYDIVRSGDAASMCMECANEKWTKAQAEGIPLPRPLKNAGDHLRKDGPH